MTASDLDLVQPDAFSADGECRRRLPTPVIIGVTPHTHVCREPVDDESRHHDGAHECTCRFQW